MQIHTRRCSEQPTAQRSLWGGVCVLECLHVLACEYVCSAEHNFCPDLLLRSHLQCRRPSFNSWVGKIRWRRDRLPSPEFWPGEFHGLYSPRGRKELDTTERLSLLRSGWLQSEGRWSAEMGPFPPSPSSVGPSSCTQPRQRSRPQAHTLPQSQTAFSR